jgi:hypothetical protein
MPLRAASDVIVERHLPRRQCQAIYDYTAHARGLHMEPGRARQEKLKMTPDRAQLVCHWLDRDGNLVDTEQNHKRSTRECSTNDIEFSSR